jgi:serine protease Do
MGVDDQNDLAVLKIDANHLPVAPLGSSDNLILGEWSIAIGNPYGFVLANTEPSVTVGVVSGVGRNLVTSPEQSTVYVDMIQTDAAINPGNSGGPLVNADGEVIGVNSSIYSPSGGSVGIGFAIPINRARRVVEDLMTHGSVRQAWTGVKPEVLDPTDFTVKPPKGVVVASVAPGSPAARAGLERGDVIEHAGARTLHNSYDWEAELLELRVGEKVPLLVQRGSQELRMTVQTVDLPEVNAPRVTVLREIQLITLTPAIRSERGLRSSAGAYVQSVSPRVSDAIGLQTGDVIVQINHTHVTSAEAAAAALNGGRGVVVMYVERQGQYYSTEFVTQ